MKKIVRWIVGHSTTFFADGWDTDTCHTKQSALDTARAWRQEGRTTTAPVRVEIPIPEKEKSRG